ncbi:ATP-dependent DNA helicase [Corynebacterium sp. sy039]|uniref:ATP-dependent DNA helicase n=1 Tax=Corynebacterium sp. sy039 TaxID=2599641 RepID=UPI0011B7F079|nr:ATP-dependent DNA helicase [Corynebacterium sp. sy039]QDZ42149.1 ATP-dependent helicase [Corynebacterium sp. sy039]
MSFANKANKNATSEIKISPQELSVALGQKFPPTEQQAAVIAAPLHSMLVVAGAGAGKTETMAARVVWLVANGFIRPDQVLGLTFTRKAAQGLSARIRQRLEQLVGAPIIKDLDPTGELEKTLETIAPVSSTYDAFVGKVMGEFGLLLPAEPGARLIGETELYQRAHTFVTEYRGTLSTSHSTATVAGTLLKLIAELDNHLIDEKELAEETDAFDKLFDELPPGPRQKSTLNQTLQKIRDLQLNRLEYVDLVRLFKQQLREDRLKTFGEQTAQAARLARQDPSVGALLSQRYPVVMLDEYQDTSYAQRVLLRSLFAHSAVTAVGDPMQSIYGWRGATAANLEHFIADYAIRDEQGEISVPVERKELTTSFRNPEQVLALANDVAASVLEKNGADKRPVSPLQPGPGAQDGMIQFGFFATGQQECDFIVDELAQAYERSHIQSDGAAKDFRAAILLRKNAQAAPFAQALAERGIPYEIADTSGLIHIPEVADLIAVATMLIRPQDSHAALRILLGPRIQLGLNDLGALAQRAATLAGRVRHEGQTQPEEQSKTPEEKLKDIIAELYESDPDFSVGLADALADLGEPEQYSVQGYQRLYRLSGELRALRTHSLHQSLSDLFNDIERVMGIRTEVLSRQDPHAAGAVGTVHLDQFAKVVADYAKIPGATLGAFLDYLRDSEKWERGLSQGQVRVNTQRVQILTIHKAKGLEWDFVIVPGVDQKAYVTNTSTWLSKVEYVPCGVKGDPDDAVEPGVPVLDLVEVENRKDLEEALKHHKNEYIIATKDEATRLFYVALTRSERRLLITASAENEAIVSGDREPYELFSSLAAHYPDYVTQWYGQNLEVDISAESDQPLCAKPPVSAVVEGAFPQQLEHSHKAALLSGAQLVRQAQQQLPELSQDREIYGTWEKEVAALIEEHRLAQQAYVDIELSQELTATDLVSLSSNPEYFARRQRRPVPYKPQSSSRLGESFHSWLEKRVGVQALLDENELVADEEQVSTEQLDQLKAAFLASDWAQRTPTYVEYPFEIAIGRVVVRGRMDAVFTQPDGTWQIIDWKTGHIPGKKEMESAKIQLAVYRLALSRLHGIPVDSVSAAFYYVAHDVLVAPKDLPTQQELEQLLLIESGGSNEHE